MYYIVFIKYFVSFFPVCFLDKILPLDVSLSLENAERGIFFMKRDGKWRR